MNETKTERGLQIAANLTTIMSAMRGVVYTMVIIGLPVIGCKALPLIDKVIPLLDRAVDVLENVDDRIERAFESLAPLGSEAVTKGVETLKNVDAKTIGNELTEAAKRLLKKK